MKTTVKVAVFIIGILLTILIQMALISDNTRVSENENALSAAVEQTLEQLSMEKGYSIENQKELIADFNQRLLLQINSDSDIQVDVLTADLEKGILDIRVTEKYKTVKGNKKEVSCRKTVFLEQHDDTYEKTYRTVSFWVGNNSFSHYTAYEGDTVADPGKPMLPGRFFDHWKMENSDEPVDLNGLRVTGDMIFRAVFR